MFSTRADQVELEQRRALAEQVREALELAGMAVSVSEGPSSHVPGVEVEIDPFLTHEGGGVFVDWHPGEGLVEQFAEPLMAGDFDHPAIRFNGVVGEAMTLALSSILSARGIRAQRPADDLRPSGLQVFAD